MKMKFFKTIILICSLSFLAFSGMHDYYISITEIEYDENEKSLQIASRIFLNDFESALRNKYNKTFTFGGENESANLNQNIEDYLHEKIAIKINGNKTDFVFLKKDYDNDIIKCYLEINNVESIQTIEISNKVMLDFIVEQQNIIKTRIYTKQKNFILTSQNSKSFLSF